VVELAALAKVAQSALKPVGKRVEHDGQCTDGSFGSSLCLGLGRRGERLCFNDDVGRKRWLKSPR
jgi:hypothetical protein